MYEPYLTALSMQFFRRAAAVDTPHEVRTIGEPAPGSASARAPLRYRPSLDAVTRIRISASGISVSSSSAVTNRLFRNRHCCIRAANRPPSILVFPQPFIGALPTFVYKPYVIIQFAGGNRTTRRSSEETSYAVENTDKIWHNGKMSTGMTPISTSFRTWSAMPPPFSKASAATTPSRARRIFRLREHMQRLIEFRIHLPHGTAFYAG